MNGGVTVFRNNTLGNEDGVFEVVTVPRHERDQHVLAKRQFTFVGGSTISNHVTACNLVAQAHQRTLVDVGVLVGALIFSQRVNIHTHFAGNSFIVIHTHHHTAGIYVIHHAATMRGYNCA